MNTLKKFRFAYLILAAALLLSACLATAANDGSTSDATQAAELIETAVAQALKEQAAQQAEAAPQATATIIAQPEATKTAIPAPATVTLVPTITPLVLVPTSTPASSGDGSYTPAEYECQLVSIQPPPNASSVFSKGGTFDINITIKNSGTAVWPAGYDLTFYNSANSTNMAPSFPAVLELPEVKPGESFSFGPYDGFAPDEKGHYVMTFELQGVDCWPYVAIDVK